MNTLISRDYVFFLLATLCCGVVIFPFLFPFLAGVTLAFLSEPLVEKCIHAFDLKKPIWKWLVSLGVVLIILFAVIGPILTLLTTGIQELISLINLLQENIKREDLFHSAQKLRDALNHFGFRFSIDDIVSKASEFTKSTSVSLLTEVGKALSATPEYILKVAIFLLTWFFFLVVTVILHGAYTSASIGIAHIRVF